MIGEDAFRGCIGLSSVFFRCIGNGIYSCVSGEAELDMMGGTAILGGITIPGLHRTTNQNDRKSDALASDGII